MHRSHAVAGAILVLALASATVATASSAPDRVVGAGSVTFRDHPAVGSATTEWVTVDARSGSNGEDASGIIVQHSPLGDVRAEVTCLDVVGTRAVVGGTIVSGTYLGRSYPAIALLIEDGGPGGATDGWTGFIFGTAWPDPCARLLEIAPHFPGFAPLPLEQGAFTVSDTT